MVDALLLGMIGAPLLGGIVLATVCRRTSSTTAHAAALALAGMSVLCALALLPYAGQALGFAPVWLPGMGAMTLDLAESSLYAALATSAAAFLVLLGTISGPAPLPARSGGLLLVALSAGSVAFVAGHFLLRYAALEIVALAIALAPLVELGPEEGAPIMRHVYLILRIGDAGLLVAILILLAASGTLVISPALQAGEALGGERLVCTAAGMALAVWVKVGGWPFHIWRRSSSSLSLPARAWLYAALLPNLGLYLLYRLTPLLAQSGPVQHATLWVGVSIAALAAFVALTQRDVSTGLIYVDAAMGGLALMAGTSHLQTAVWMSILAFTPVRLLLYMAADLDARRLRTTLLALGGVALTLWGMLLAAWARAAGAPPDALFLGEASVVLLGVWAVAAASRSSSSYRPATRGATAPLPWTRWAVVGVLGAAILGSVLLFDPLLQGLVHASHGTLPAQPSLLLLAQYVVTSPATWIVALLAVVLWLLRWRPGPAAILPEPAYDLEEGLSRIALILNEVVEAGIQERIVGGVVRLVVDSARFAQRVIEHQVLEKSIHYLARAAVTGGQLAYRIVEEEGLEGFLRRAVQTVLGLARIAQRWHTGKLRRNLVWVTVSLGLALLIAFVL